MKLNEKLTNVDYSNDHVVSDANNATETGGYYTNADTTNLPMSGSAGYLNVMSHFGSDLNSVTQIWTRYKDGEMYIRHWYSFDTPEITSGWGEWERLTTEPTVLYENSNGSNGNITLNDSVDNYKYIEVYYKNNDNRYNSKKFYDINGKYVVLDSYYSSNSNIVWKQQTRLFNGTQFNVVANAECSAADITYIKTNSNTFVTLVLGYK